jgi:hypothetical protein
MLEFPRIQDRRGNLTYIESYGNLPFDIRRVYYLYDVPGGASRGGHAHRSLEQCLIAVSGSFDVKIDTGTRCDVINLNRSFYGLYLPRLVWRELDNFSTGSICLVLASEPYLEADYIRDRTEFLRLVMPT